MAVCFQVCKRELAGLFVQLPPMDRAVTHLYLAKVAVALFDVYLQATGTPLSGHPFQQEKASSVLDIVSCGCKQLKRAP